MKTKLEIIELRRRSIAYGMRRGLDFNTAEDFAQHVALELVCYKRMVGLKELFCDFVRMALGRNGLKVLPNAISYDEKVDLAPIVHAEAFLGSGRVSLSIRDKKILYMVLGGFTLGDIAKTMHLDASRVSQLVTMLEEKIINRV